MLSGHGIKLVADVRSIPRSRRHPQFEQGSLAASLAQAGIGYRWLPVLGGRRRPREGSPNHGWRNASFRAYADYMQTPEFTAGLAELEALAQVQPTAVMCAEAVPWRCHRSLIADALVVAGYEVLNIFDKKVAKPHALNPMARVAHGIITYPPAQEPLLP